ncbi:MAG: dihydrodipicolinate synthase family protein [Rhodospirillales bacterium]|nr:dihydrodipicolinate synthase family protein [Alphaproteobacteria bacterium]MBL6948329.1 dihydrodipicolinate synthase family protein [Rhodospirillales bacterium]
MSQQEFAFSGVYAAALTPQTDNGTPDVGLMASHCRWLLDNGCDGLAILGTTGEANSFSVDEKIALLDGLAEAGIPGDTLMPGTGACAIPDAVALTRAALKNGAPGVLMLPPFYYKNPSDDGLFAAYSEIIQQVGDADLKICLYHFPQMSTVPISYALIERLLKEYPDTVAGMKDSSGDADNMIGAAKAFPGFAVFAGSDELMLPLIEAGGAGCITACANVGSKLAGEVYQGWKNGDDVQATHETLTAVRNAIVKFPLSTALKTLMARHSGTDGWLNIRPPLMRMNDADRDALFDAFDAIGFSIPPVS